MEQELTDRLGVILQRYSASALGEIDAREVIREVFQTIYRLDITLPARWVMLDKTLATLAGVALAIYPDFNVFEVARPYATRLLGQRFRPDVAADRLRVDLGRYAEAFGEYPFQLAELLDELKDGEVEITVEPRGVADAINAGQAALNRLCLAMVAAALIVGSSLISVFAGSAGIAGVAFVALPGLVIAVVLIAWLAVGIVRSGRW
jgi:ubiquinone biosynthesis protein